MRQWLHAPSSTAWLIWDSDFMHLLLQHGYYETVIMTSCTSSFYGLATMRQWLHAPHPLWPRYNETVTACTSSFCGLATMTKWLHAPHIVWPGYYETVTACTSSFCGLATVRQWLMHLILLWPGYYETVTACTSSFYGLATMTKWLHAPHPFMIWLQWECDCMYFSLLSTAWVMWVSDCMNVYSLCCHSTFNTIPSSHRGWPGCQR